MVWNASLNLLKNILSSFISLTNKQKKPKKPSNSYLYQKHTHTKYILKFCVSKLQAVLKLCGLE